MEDASPSPKHCMEQDAGNMTEKGVQQEEQQGKKK